MKTILLLILFIVAVVASGRLVIDIANSIGLAGLVIGLITLLGICGIIFHRLLMKDVVIAVHQHNEQLQHEQQAHQIAHHAGRAVFHATLVKELRKQPGRELEVREWQP